MVLRLASASDTSAITSLFAQVFGHLRSEKRWTWQYLHSPKSDGVVNVAVEGDEVVGCAALMRQDLNHVGRRIPAAQACDGMFASGHRGSGHYARLASQNYEAARSMGLAFITGFPNHNSFPILIDKLGHQRILVLRHYHRRLGGAKIWGTGLDRLVRPLSRFHSRAGLAIASARLDRRLDMAVGADVPKGSDVLLSRWRRQQVLSVWKDPAYLRWRYVDHPDHTYHFHALRDSEELMAIAVVRRREDAAVICELLHPGNDPREMAQLLRQIVSWYDRDPSCQRVEFLGADLGLFDAAFQKAGFLSTPHSPLVMIATGLEDAHPLAAALTVANNWSVSYGDTDII